MVVRIEVEGRQAITKRELCERAGTYRKKVERMMRRGTLPFVKLGRSVLFRLDEVQHLLGESLSNPTATATA